MESTLDRPHVKHMQDQLLGELHSCSAEMKQLVKTAKALGLDGEVIATFEGTGSARATPTAATAGRAPTRRRTRRRAGGRSGNGAAPTAGQLLDAIREFGSANQTQLANRFGVTRQTIARKLDTLVKKGDAVREGEGARVRWRAHEPASA